MADVTIKDYQDWLKNNKKVKVAKEGETLSAYDELENKALYNQYVKEAELFNQRQQAEAKVQAQQETALRDNYVAQEKAQKQAQDVLKMQGITSGISESGLIDLYAQGAAARAKIISDNNTAENDILSKYQEAVANSKLDTSNKIAEIDAQRLLKEEQDKDLEKEKGLATYQQALEDYSSGLIDEKTYDSILEKYRDNLTDYDISKAATVKDTVKEAYAPYEVEEALNKFDNDMMEFEELQNVYDSYGNYLTSEDTELIERYNEARKDYERVSMLQNTKHKLETGDVPSAGEISLKNNPWETGINQSAHVPSDAKERYKNMLISDGGIDVFSNEFKNSDLGSFYDTGKAGSKQEELATKYIDDIKAGKVQIGQVCVFNYGIAEGAAIGSKNTNRGAYVYKGSGVLQKISNEELKAAWEQGNVYIPNGYKKYNDTQMTLYK